jgi:hypothetical protein
MGHSSNLLLTTSGFLSCQTKSFSFNVPSLKRNVFYFSQTLQNIVKETDEKEVVLSRGKDCVFFFLQTL